MPVIAIGGDDLIARVEGRLHAHYDGFLADIEVAEAADQTHAIELTRLLLKTADEQHVGIEFLRAHVIGRCRVGLDLLSRFGHGR